MKKAHLFRVHNHLLLKNLGLVYWHVGVVIIWLFVMITAGGFAIAVIDGNSIYEGIYLALITGLTVGYGDLVPVSALSKVIAVVIAIIGTVFAGIIVAASLKALELTLAEQVKDSHSPEQP